MIIKKVIVQITKLRTLLDIDYQNQIAREEYPSNLRKNYVQKRSRQLQLNTKNQALEKKDKNKYSTTETVKDFF